MKIITTKSEAIKQLFSMLTDCSIATSSHYTSCNFNSAYLPTVTENEKDNAEFWGLKEKSISLPLQDAAKGLDEVIAFYPDGHELWGKSVEIETNKVLEEIKSLIESAFIPPDEYHQKSKSNSKPKFTKPEIIEYVEPLADWIQKGEVALFAWTSEEESNITNALVRIKSESEHLFLMRISYACAYGD